MTPLAMLVLGFFLGMRHATDSDHVVALSAIVSRERTSGAGLRIGALWGLGHTATIVTVGGAIVVFGWVIPPRLGLSIEMTVAVMLIALGGMNLSGALTRLQGLAHGHLHPHELQRLPKRARARRLAFRSTSKREPRAANAARRRGRLRPLAIGMVHGLAGSAAIALLVVSSVKNTGTALAYLGVFGVGTVAGMMLVTLAMSLPISLLSRRFSNIEQLLARSTGVLSIAFGLFLVYRIGVVEGLFFGTPNWAPR